MDLSILFIGGDATVRELTTIARQAEDIGFTSLYMADAYHSAWVPLTAMAAT
jgi:alkanesulfonate monooxygenase SsuD/methylene tetrahydromethanopterin reductase-like flavin-dependent oxidoreductase (luciferase family)